MAVINIEEAASAGSRVAGRGVGAGIGAAFSSPAGIASIAAIAIIALIIFFRKDIGGFFSGLKFPEFPKIEFPAFPEIKFPEFDFPEFDFPELPDFTSIFSGFQEQINQGLAQQNLNLFNFLDNLNPFTQPVDTSMLKDVENTGLLSPDERNKCQCGSSIIQDFQGDVTEFCKTCQGGGMLITGGFDKDALPSQDTSLNIPKDSGFIGGIGGGLLDFLGLTPAEKFVQDKIQSDELPAGFSGGGSSFIGGQILPFGTGQDISKLSLSEIIDRFGVTASQAANIKAIAADDFGDFDFGTNTGLGIGSVVPDIISVIGSSGSNVSDSSFQGLTAQEIANILTGGNISNF